MGPWWQLVLQTMVEVDMLGFLNGMVAVGNKGGMILTERY